VCNYNVNVAIHNIIPKYAMRLWGDDNDDYDDGDDDIKWYV
jgi:hypothetical protein